MGLKMSYEIASGVTLPDAYFKISHVELIMMYDAEYKASVLLRGYKDKATRDAGGEPFNEWRHFIAIADYPTWYDGLIVSEAGKNHISRSYDYLKSLAEFATAVDA